MDPCWAGVADILREDFADLFEMEQVIRAILRLVLAMTLGGVLGFERQWTGKEAGLRTHMLVALGAALFVLVPQQAGMTMGDLSRVIQGIVAGIGFIGGGVIFKMTDRGEVKGLTTAVGIWLTVAVGVAVGLGRLGVAIVGVILALVILSALTQVERWLDSKSPNAPSSGSPGADSSRGVLASSHSSPPEANTKTSL